MRLNQFLPLQPRENLPASSKAEVDWASLKATRLAATKRISARQVMVRVISVTRLAQTSCSIDVCDEIATGMSLLVTNPRLIQTAN